MKDIPAFPRPHSGATQYAQEGMSLRDYFAAKAMQALIQRDEQSIAWEAYGLADEMMKARDNNG